MLLSICSPIPMYSSILPMQREHLKDLVYIYIIRYFQALFSLLQACKTGFIIIPILYLGKMRHKNVKEFGPNNSFGDRAEL